MNDETFRSIQDDDLRRYLLEIARSMKAHSEVMDELSARVVQLEENQQAFIQSVNQRLNGIEDQRGGSE